MQGSSGFGATGRNATGCFRSSEMICNSEAPIFQYGFGFNCVPEVVWPLITSEQAKVKSGRHQDSLEKSCKLANLQVMLVQSNQLESRNCSADLTVQLILTSAGQMPQISIGQNNYCFDHVSQKKERGC